MKQSLRPIDLAREVSLSVQMVRNYEQWGFIPHAERSQTGYRRYGQQHMHAIRTARTMIAGYGWQTALTIMQHIHQGDITAAVAAIDACHADLHRRRQAIEATLDTLRATAEMVQRLPETPKRPRWRSRLHINEVAQEIGITVSKVRFWEAQGLLQPQRDPENNYRLYDEEQLRRLRVVTLLRDSGYGFDTIRTVVAELAIGRTEQAIHAAEQSLRDLAQASKRCSAATAAAWTYIESWAESGPIPCK
ncbi:MAG TPA: MerR family transcriptional regulator [Ktedonobacteraceae bacterium]|nr:MerR family transcriptional regulator [Ktedonobacteraceae bacterium]